MNIKYNINKVHGNLITSFGQAAISEKSDKRFGNYFEISVIKENKSVRIILTKNDIANDVFAWSYYSNPLDEKSYLIERRSSIDSIAADVADIISKNRFEEDYLSQIK